MYEYNKHILLYICGYNIFDFINVFLSHKSFHFLLGNYLTQFFMDTTMKFYNNIVLESGIQKSTKIRTQY